jgi:site-specific recombinase XerD
VLAARSPLEDRVVAAWLDDLLSDHTRDAYGRDVAGFVAWCDAKGHDLLRVGVAEVSDYRDECGDEGVRPATIARRLSALASFFDHALADRRVDANPVVAVTRPSSPPHRARAGLTRREASALMSSARDIGPKVVVLVALLLVEGLKLAEVLGLNVEHLDAGGRTMRATVTRRGTPHSVGLSRRTARAITAHLAGRSGGPLLVGDSPTQDGRSRLTRFGADFLLKRAAAGAGLDPLSANTLRRTYIAASHRDGATVGHIAERVGHADPRATRRYLM